MVNLYLSIGNIIRWQVSSVVLFVAENLLNFSNSLEDHLNEMSRSLF